MAKTKISEFDSTPANNTDIDSINIAEGCAPSGINNAIRELMSQLKDQQTGASGDNFTVGGNLAVTGTATFTGIPSGPTASVGTNTTQLATTAFVTSANPTGVINMWGTGTAPTGWLLCAGAAVSRSTYSALFAVIGTTFGVGDGTTTFNLPNYTNRMPYGTTVATTGGSADAVVVSHTHAITDPGHAHAQTFYYDNGNSGTNPYGSLSTTTVNVNTQTATTGISINTAGVSGTNANLPPYLGINFIIKT
jgi:microcystin-dependent protein